MNAPNLLAPADLACCDDETWKPLPGWPHEISTCGRGRSIDRLGGDGIWRLGAPLPPQLDKRPGKGYGYFDLRDGKRRRRIPVAVAVLEAHDKPRPGPGYEACHLNDIRTDNHRANLDWDTRAANLARMWEQRRLRQADTGTAPETPETCLGGRLPRWLRPALPVSTRVRGNASQGTGSLLSAQDFPSVLLPVQPSLCTLRTLFLTLRTLFCSNRRVA